MLWANSPKGVSMSKANKKYVQAKLERKQGCFKIETTSWIPSNIAVEGGQVKLKEAKGWSFWSVVKRGNKEISYQEAREQSTAWKHFKKVFE